MVQLNTKYLFFGSLLGCVLTWMGLLIAFSGMAAMSATIPLMETTAVMGACLLIVLSFKPVREANPAVLAACVLSAANACWAFFSFVVMAMYSTNNSVTNHPAHGAAASGYFFISLGQACVFLTSLVMYTGLFGGEAGYSSV